MHICHPSPSGCASPMGSAAGGSLRSCPFPRGSTKIQQLRACPGSQKGHSKLGSQPPTAREPSWCCEAPAQAGSPRLHCTSGQITRCQGIPGQAVRIPPLRPFSSFHEYPARIQGAAAASSKQRPALTPGAHWFYFIYFIIIIFLLRKHRLVIPNFNFTSFPPEYNHPPFM